MEHKTGSFIIYTFQRLIVSIVKSKYRQSVRMLGEFTDIIKEGFRSLKKSLGFQDHYRNHLFPLIKTNLDYLGNILEIHVILIILFISWNTFSLLE